MFWSTPLWNAIHVLSVQCEKDDINKKKVFELIILLCKFIPCMSCRNHSANYFKKNPDYDNIENYYFEFHNAVKRRKRLRIATNIKILEKYKILDREKNIILATVSLKLNKNQKLQVFKLFRDIKFKQH